MDELDVVHLALRFMARTQYSPQGCWEWAGSHSEGYGHLRFDGRTLQAHRVAYFLATRRWPTNVLHHCDNRGCVRFAHLYEGTKAQNAADMVARGRVSRVGNRGANRGKSVNAGTSNGRYKHGRYMRNPE